MVHPKRSTTKPADRAVHHDAARSTGLRPTGTPGAAEGVRLALQTTALDVATIALEWAGDHAASLGADPGRLFVAGGGLAATAALYARDEGWPPLARQLLFGPERSGWPPADASLGGVAPRPWSVRRGTPAGCARPGSR